MLQPLGWRIKLQAFLHVGGQLLWFRSAGADAPAHVPPPLEWTATHPLMEPQRSRLVVLTKK